MDVHPPKYGTIGFDPWPYNYWDIRNFIIPIDFRIFQRGETTNLTNMFIYPVAMKERAFGVLIQWRAKELL